MNIQVPWLIRIFIRNVTWRGSKKEKVIYLTFDDGPIPEVTPNVLEILDEFNAKATFFCVGENVFKHPEVYNEILRRGHAVGNHTYNHLKGFSTYKEEYLANVDKASSYINSKLFRPPHGQISPGLIKLLSNKKYKIIMWDFITFDYDKDLSPEAIQKIVQNRTRNGSIVVFHDSLKARQNVLEVLPQALSCWRKEGYMLKTIE